MNEQMIEQQSQPLSYEAVSLTCEVSDEALEAAGGGCGLGAGTHFPTMGWGCCM